MKIINPEVFEIKQEYSEQGIYKAIEIAGRNCYKSEDKICEGSAEKLIENFKKRQHGSPMEFGTVYLKFNKLNSETYELLEFYKNNKYSKLDFRFSSQECFITTNYRVLFENNRLDDLKYLCEPTENHEKRRFFRIICDRALLAEITRHRVFSYCVESQRYCNYSKDQFSNEITVIKPCFFEENSVLYCEWKASCESSESYYFSLLDHGATPEQARTVLPNSTKTDICMCGFESDWEHFFELRCSEKAHPQAREIANKIKEIF